MPDLPITLPFLLIDIAAEGEQFRFLCTEIHPLFRTPEQTEPNDFDCEFAVEYSGSGLSAQFGCDISAGNVYSFYQSLETAYQQLDSEKPAVLENYGSLDRLPAHRTFSECRKTLSQRHSDQNDARSELYRRNPAQSAVLLPRFGGCAGTRKFLLIYTPHGGGVCERLRLHGIREKHRSRSA